MKNIFRHELKAYSKSIIVWACSMTLLAVLYIFLFKELGRDIEEFKAFLSNMPEVLKKGFNILVDSVATLEGFYSFVFSFVLLCGGIQAMNLGIAIVSKEVRDKTADFFDDQADKPARHPDVQIAGRLFCFADDQYYLSGAYGFRGGRRCRRV